MKSTAVFLTLALISLMAAPLFADEDGAALFKKSCAPCHGALGAGDTPMGKKLGVKALDTPEVQKMTDEQMTQLNTKGKGKMPSFAGKLSPEQLNAIVGFIRTLKK